MNRHSGKARHGLSVRDSLPEDLVDIFRIRQDSQVRPHQYKLRPTDTVDIWEDRLSGNDQIGDIRFRCSSILLDDTLIGHVTQHHYRIDDVGIAQCGWNLAPDYWGKGLMAAALSILFERFFSEQRISHVFADCFRGNVRSKRVMEKLGFVPVGIELSERISLAWQARCLHWIDRFRLDSDDRCRR